jgi:nitrate reductase cytochrome c-type subunit
MAKRKPRLESEKPDALTPSPRQEVEAEASRCLKCGSTERERYTATRVQPFAGVDPAGRPYTHIVRRWTRCAACKQARIDRTFENRVLRAETE